MKIPLGYKSGNNLLVQRLAFLIDEAVVGRFKLQPADFTPLVPLANNLSILQHLAATTCSGMGFFS